MPQAKEPADKAPEMLLGTVTRKPPDGVRQDLEAGRNEQSRKSDKTAEGGRKPVPGKYVCGREYCPQGTDCARTAEYPCQFRDQEEQRKSITDEFQLCTVSDGGSPGDGNGMYQLPEAAVCEYSAAKGSNFSEHPVERAEAGK